MQQADRWSPGCDLGAVGDAPDERPGIAHGHGSQRRSGCSSERRRVEQRDDGPMRGRRAAARAAAGREREHQLCDESLESACLRGVETCESQTSGGRPVRGQDGRAPIAGRLDRHEGLPCELVHQIALAGELVVKVVREAVVGYEDVRLAAQAPAQRGVRAAGGARAGLRQ